MPGAGCSEQGSNDAASTGQRPAEGRGEQVEGRRGGRAGEPAVLLTMGSGLSAGQTGWFFGVVERRRRWGS
jgi:hypothetical protein